MATLSYEEKCQVLSSTLLRACESDEALRTLARLCRERHCKDGEIIFMRRDPPKEVYVIVRGGVRFTRYNEAGDQMLSGEEFAGYWFGELSMMTRNGRSHDAECIGDAVLLTLSKADFEYLLSINDFARIVLARTAKRLHYYFDQMENSLLLSVSGRLAQRLLDIVRQNQHSRTVKVSQEDLGRMIGATRQSVGRILTGWAKDGVIQTCYGRIEVIDTQRLRGLASPGGF